MSPGPVTGLSSGRNTVNGGSGPHERSAYRLPPLDGYASSKSPSTQPSSRFDVTATGHNYPSPGPRASTPQGHINGTSSSRDSFHLPGIASLNYLPSHSAPSSRHVSYDPPPPPGSSSADRPRSTESPPRQSSGSALLRPSYGHDRAATPPNGRIPSRPSMPETSASYGAGPSRSPGEL